MMPIANEFITATRTDRSFLLLYVYRYIFPSHVDSYKHFDNDGRMSSKRRVTHHMIIVESVSLKCIRSRAILFL